MKLEDLKQPFSEALFLQINKQLIDTEFVPSQLSVSPENSKFITNAKYYGKYDDLDLHILTVEHSGTEDARVGVSLDIFKLMKKYSLQNALAAAHSKSSDSWRYSLITSNLSVNDKGRVIKEFSNPRRYSFVLGPDQKVLRQIITRYEKGHELVCSSNFCKSRAFVPKNIAELEAQGTNSKGLQAPRGRSPSATTP